MKQIWFCLLDWSVITSGINIHTVQMIFSMDKKKK